MHVRLAREGARRRLSAVLAALGVLAACGQPPGDVTMTVVLDPAAPVAGAATTAHIRLRTPDGQPIPATGVRLEAHMTHPGMTPVLPVVVRVGDGDYTSRVEFSMAGDWTLVVTGELAGGRRFTRESRVAGVGPPR